MVLVHVPSTEMTGPIAHAVSDFQENVHNSEFNCALPSECSIDNVIMTYCSIDIVTMTYCSAQV